MKIQIIHQSANRTTALVANDNDSIVGKLDVPAALDGGEVERLAREYADAHPELFPRRERKQRHFDVLFGEHKQ